MNTSRKDLYEAANKLLLKAGFSYDGSKKKDFSRKQKFFEKKIIIMTPMGNGSR